MKPLVVAAAFLALSLARPAGAFTMAETSAAMGTHNTLAGTATGNAAKIRGSISGKIPKAPRTSLASAGGGRRGGARRGGGGGSGRGWASASRGGAWLAGGPGGAWVAAGPWSHGGAR